MNDIGNIEQFTRIEGIILVKEQGAQKNWYAAVWNEQPVDIERMNEKRTETLEADGDESCQSAIYKIMREDLAKLPRCEWKLANNHFLLHGYRNYHHLVSFEKDGTCWIGVPGIFHPEERKAANAFGFEQFMKPEEGAIELLEEQKEENEEFGYWCRAVSEVVEG